jgi:Domain of unknown function (DUF1918)
VGHATRRRNVKGRVGDRIVVESERATHSGRVGVIEEVLQEEPPRYLVRWEDDRTSSLTPAAGVASIEPKRQRAKAS